MTAYCLAGFIFGASFLLVGCNGSNAPAAVSIRQHQPPGEPQPKLPTIKLWLGAHEIIAEQALSPHQIQKGMMFRQSMADNEGMLFVFPEPHRASFWMRNTLIPLSCAFIDPDGVILEVREMNPLDETAVTADSNRVQFVLEMNGNWFERHQVKPGSVVRTERGTLRQTYFATRFLELENIDQLSQLWDPLILWGFSASRNLLARRWGESLDLNEVFKWHECLWSEALPR
jgi:uncharacterized protein